MKLFNKTIDRQLFKQYALGSDLSKQEVVVKIFNPVANGSWFILNSDPEDPDYLWAIVDLGYGAEVGSVSRSELENYKGRFGLGFERDLGFDPINAEELYQGLRNGEYYADGGETKGKDTWQNIFEEFDFKKGRSMYGLDMYYKKGYIASVDHELRNVELMFEDNVIYKGFSVQGLLSALQNQFGKRNFADGGDVQDRSMKVGDKVYRYYINYDPYKEVVSKSKTYTIVSIEERRPTFENGYSRFIIKTDDGIIHSENTVIKVDYVESNNYVKGNYFESNNYAKGGNIENFSDNQQMIMNQNVELEHHHEELEDILENEIPVPAWVVAKMETATQNLSDITHYLDGQKEIMEEELEGDDDDDDDDDDDEMSMQEIENKVVVEPIIVTAGDKTELTKNFTDDAFGNLKGFLKGFEGIDLREDYTFDYKDEQYEIEPIINSDENGVSNAVFSVFNGDGDEVGEITYSSDGGKQKFTANSELFVWNNTKFEDGGFMNNVYAKGGIVDVEKVNKADEIYREHNRERKEKGIENFSKESVALWNEKYNDRLEKLKLTLEEKNALNPKKWYADGGYFDGAIPNTSSYMSNYAKGGEVENYRTLSFKTRAIAEKNKKGIETYFGERLSNSMISKGIDERGDDGFFVEYSLKKENYAKGGEIAKAEILGLKRNIMGTTDIEMKITGMRKPQSFIVYPISKDDSGDIITIQSETRIGKIDLSSGRGLMSQSHSNGAYFVHFQMDKLTPFSISEIDLEDLKAFINKTSGSNVGSSIIKSDNSGASRIFAKGGQIPDWLFIGVYPNAYIFADKRIDNNGYYHEIGRIVFNPFQIRIFDNSSKYASAIDIINKEAKELEKQGYVEISATGQRVDIKKMSNGGSFMSDVYAKGGSVKKDWWQTVVNPNENFHNYDNRKPIDWEVDDFKEWVVSNSDLDGNVDKEVLEVIKMPKSKLTVEYLNKNGSGKNNNEYYKEFGNWQSALYDVFTQIKKDYLFKKERKYILKSDIKTVTVNRKGKEVTYNASDVLNGAYVLAKGGDIASKANYIGKNDVVEVELKDGSKVKPANGYWIKKGAEPIGTEPTPNPSAKTETKVGETYIRKDMRNNWKAETNIDDFNGYDWRLSTIKTYSGKLVSSAQGGKTEPTGTKGIEMFKYTMYEDPNYTLEVSTPKRLTDKLVSEQHDKALAKFKKFMETGTFKGGGKISNFDKLSAKVAKQYEGKPVKSQYQEEYGKYYSKEEAQEVGDKVAGKVKAMQQMSKGGAFPDYGEIVDVKDIDYDMISYFHRTNKKLLITTKDKKVSKGGVTKFYNDLIFTSNEKFDIPKKDILKVEILKDSMSDGGKTEKKENGGRISMKLANELAKKIRKDGESWNDAKKRAFAQLKK